MKYKFLLNVAVSLLIFVGIFYFVDLSRVMDVLSRANLLFFGVAVLLYLLINICIATRIKILLEEMGQKLNIIDLLKIDLAGMLASDMTPARSGYFLTAFLITSKYKTSLEKSILSIFGPQLLEFGIKIFGTAVFVLMMLSLFGLFKESMVFIVVFLGFVAGVILLFWKLLYSKNLLNKFSFLKKIKIIKKGFYLFHLMQKHSVVIKKRWVAVLLLTLSGWFLKTFEWFFLMRALGIEVFGVYDLLFLLFFQPSLTFIQFFPIPTIAGAGASEAVFSGILILLGVGAESALAFAILTRGLMVLVDLLGLHEILSLLEKEGFEHILKEIDKIDGAEVS